MIQGLASFPGIQQIASCSIVYSHGIGPASIVLSIAPQSDFETTGGTLTIFDGESTISFSDCKIDRHSLARTPAGLVWRLTLLDRRWKWAWGQISGSYNLRNDDGSLQTGSELDPQSLAALCLAALGETGYDVGRLPNDSRPLVEWNYDRPAEALAQLCDQLGARVVLRLDGTVSLEVVGVGATLPTDGTADDSLAIDPPEQPDQMSVVCGRDRFQADFPLQAVGLDSDGNWKPIEQLAYRPSAGWSTIDLPYFTAVAAGDRQRARETVFRCYQVVVPATVPDFGSVTSLSQIVPIEREQVATTTTTVAGAVQTVNKPVQVYGSYFLGTESLRNSCQPSQIAPNAFENTLQEYKQGFTIDENLALVKFADHVFANASDDSAGMPGNLTRSPATLHLRVACSVSDGTIRAPVRYSRTRSYGQLYGTPTRYLVHSEIVLTHVPDYGPNYSVQGTSTNASDVDAQCDDYLDAAETEYQITTPQTISYGGLRGDIDLDGAIQQVTLNIGPSGATMTASFNDEQIHKFPSYKQRRELDRLKKIRDAERHNKPSVRRQNERVTKRKG